MQVRPRARPILVATADRPLHRPLLGPRCGLCAPDARWRGGAVGIARSSQRVLPAGPPAGPSTHRAHLFEMAAIRYDAGDMPDFRLVAPFETTGDQPRAIEHLVDGLQEGLKHQTLLGATGTGKTFSIAKAIEAHQKPTLVLAHNKTLAAQLYAEFREFFPDNAVEYFVSYFDYYQPEAYLPRSDTYIEKDSSRNDEIDRLRHSATHALFERRDVIVVASVSCIYGIGAPVDYGATVLRLRKGGQYRRDGVLRHLVDLQYQRNDTDLARARFRGLADTLEIRPASDDRIVLVEVFGDNGEP